MGMQAVAETTLFQKQSARLFTRDEKAAVIEFLAAHPGSGDIIPGTGGVRKVRVPARGKGSRGGARVIYYLLDEDAPLFALLVYGKGEKDSLTSQEKTTLKALSIAIKASYRSTT
jgi:RelE toxin of RelEB toxin-antitoxin system